MVVWGFWRGPHCVEWEIHSSIKGVNKKAMTWEHCDRSLSLVSSHLCSSFTSSAPLSFLFSSPHQLASLTSFYALNSLSLPLSLSRPTLPSLHLPPPCSSLITVPCLLCECVCVCVCQEMTEQKLMLSAQWRSDEHALSLSSVSPRLSHISWSLSKYELCFQWLSRTGRVSRYYLI